MSKVINPLQIRPIGNFNLPRTNSIVFPRSADNNDTFGGLIGLGED